jgi:hypothetical protein
MENQEFIESALREEEIMFESIPDESASPLAQPVIDKSTTNADTSNEGFQTDPALKAGEPEQNKKKPTDAPEQKIDDEPEQEPSAGSSQNTDEFTIPLEHAGLMADSIIGTIDNTLFEVGGGYFITIRKHKDFYDFDEVIQIIEEQNVKNIKRLKLDEEDKALLRPLIIQLLRKKAATLTPEKQLLMVAISILIKKAKVVMEMRSENEILVERIRDIIRKEVAAGKQNESPSWNTSPDAVHHNSGYNTEDQYTVQNATGLPDEVLEVMD